MIDESIERNALMERLLMPIEVAHLFRVKVTTVNKWARAGKLPSRWTPGGQRRFRASDVEALLDSSDDPQVTSGATTSDTGALA